MKFNRRKERKMKTKQIYRQGDVLLTLVAELPKGAKDVSPNGRIVLAYGEVTGHAHAVYDEVERESKIKPARLWDAGAERFLQVVEKTALRHEEHAPVPLEPGIYKVTIQREYAPDAIRNVAD